MEVTIQSKKSLEIGDIDYALTSIMFSVEESTAVFCTKECVAAIDTFFDDLKWDNIGNPLVEQVRFADAFMYMDTDNRFNYKGSNTVPPCNNNWMRDVCMTIYPIKQKHLDLFRTKQLGRDPSTKDYNSETGTGGNYRSAFPITDAHLVYIITNEYSASALLLMTTTIIFAVLFLISLILCCFYCCKFKKLSKSSDG